MTIKVKEITLDETHLIEDHRDRKPIDRQYKLKSDTIESSSDVRLIKVTRHEELSDHYVKQFYFDYEDADKVAYLSFDDAQAHLNDMNRQRSDVIELQKDANRELESHLKAINLILSDYFDRVDRHDIEATILNNDEEHKRLLVLQESISQTLFTSSMNFDIIIYIKIYKGD